MLYKIILDFAYLAFDIVKLAFALVAFILIGGLMGLLWNAVYRFFGIEIPDITCDHSPSH